MTHLQRYDLLIGVSLELGVLALALCVYKVMGSHGAMSGKIRDMARRLRKRDVVLESKTLDEVTGLDDPYDEARIDGDDPTHWYRLIRADRKWYPLPGLRLALADTGFEIAMEQVGQWAGFFTLWNPEGKGLFAGSDLDELKRIGERQARFRDQFNASPVQPAWQRVARN